MKNIDMPVQNKEFADVWPLIDAVPGWMSPGQEHCLYDLVRVLPNDAVILELGCYLGRSTTAMAFACRGTNRKIICVDSFCGNSTDFINGKNDITWEGDDFVDVFENNLARNNLLSHVIHFKGMTSDISPFWARNIDMLFIDAGHTYDAVLADFKAFEPYVKTGGTIALHDVTPGWPDVQRIWDENVKVILGEHGNTGSLAHGKKLGI